MNVSRMKMFAMLVVSALLVSATAVRADDELLEPAARQLSLQAKLQNLSQGDKCVTCYIYDVAEGGFPLIGAQVDVNVAPANNGVISLLIPLGAQANSLFADGLRKWVAFAVDAGTCPVVPSPEFSPRIELAAAPWAFRVNYVGNKELTDHVELGDPTTDGELRLFKSGAEDYTILLSGNHAQIFTSAMFADDVPYTPFWAGTDSNGAGFVWMEQPNGFAGVRINASENGGGPGMTLHNRNGWATINFWADALEGHAALGLNDADLNQTVYINANGWEGGGAISLRNEHGELTVAIDGDQGDAGFIGMRDSDGNLKIQLDADWQGTGFSRMVTDVVEIRGGSDLSEKFDIHANSGSPAPGMVVSIDPNQPGKLVVADQAYDSKVAGIISGAGGVRPGMLMGQSGSIADGAYPVALSGRVYCLADASNGAIQPGDLLTSSSAPGHDMKVTDAARANGAILGKALTSLPEGKGLVLVLVSLQ